MLPFAPVAYIGPGPGLAIGGSLLSLLVGLAAGLLSVLTWPFRALWTAIRFRDVRRRARVRKVIFIGFDGLDPHLTERYLAEGKLPNLAALRARGGYRRLRTTFPALSPVAWSTFATGVNPARHNIFDFLNRELKSYIPELSTAKVHSSGAVEGRRRSQTFWNILGRYRIASTVLRVPVSFPPEKFHGRMLSAMSTPDLKGTQGEFTLFTADRLKRDARGYSGVLEAEPPLKVPFRIDTSGHVPVLRIQKQAYPLREHEFTPWIRVRFRVSAWRGVSGIVRFLLRQCGPEFSLYASPVEIDPRRPAMAISHPRAYAAYLEGLLGPFATLGMAEDTWALNEGAIEDGDFLTQAWSVFEERRGMFTDALRKARRGVVGCVFDTSDRIQHMFFRQMENGSPEVIEDMYRRMDQVVAEALRYVDSRTLLLVLSDHGFCAFRRGVNLNAWLREQGYLTAAGAAGKYFEGVDWKNTPAYALGLGGLYLNLRGREPEGVVEPGEAARALKREIVRRLTELRDPETGAPAIRNVYDSDAIYSGPYTDRAPDLVVGYHEGYRTAWGTAVGVTAGEVFETNDKAWSGDHCVDPPLVKGVLFANRPIGAADPGLEDMAPTILSLFGVPPPEWMEGRPIFDAP